jgi:hypothetical protein
VTAPGDEQHRARSSSVFRFAIRGRRVERRGPPRRSSSSAFLRRVASANCPRRSTRQLHVVDDRGPTRLSMNSSSASRMRRRASSTMRPMCGSRVHRARWRPTSPTRLARKPRDKTSRLPTSSGSVIIGPRSPTDWRTCIDAQRAPSARPGISMPFCECAQSPWVLIVTSGGLSVEFDDGDGLNDRCRSPISAQAALPKRISPAASGVPRRPHPPVARCTRLSLSVGFAGLVPLSHARGKVIVENDIPLNRRREQGEACPLLDRPRS